MPFRLAEQGDRSGRRIVLLALVLSLVLHGLLFGLVFSRVPIDRQRTLPIPVALVVEQVDAPSVITPAPPPRALPTPPRATSRRQHRASPAPPPIESAASPIAVEKSPESAIGTSPDVAAAPPAASVRAARSVFGEGEVDSAAHPALRIRPRYPEHARLMGRESDVRLMVTVEADGRVSQVELLSSGGEEFDQEAENALKRAQFVPARKAGEPVAALVTFTVRFRLDE